MILAAVLIFGILTLWVPARWALSVFQIALFALAMVTLFRRRMNWHPVGALLACAALWGVFQIAAHRTIDQWKTGDAVVNWIACAAAFSLAFELATVERERFLRALLFFAVALSIIASFTALTSPPGRVFRAFDTGTNQPTLGPFVYRNQYAAFVEALLPLAIVRALLDRPRWVMYTLMAAVLFASVVAGGSRAGSILCLAEILVTPVIAFARKRITRPMLWRVLGGSFAAVAILTAVVGWEPIWNRLQEPNPYSLRAQLVRSSVQMVRDRPLAGFGLGTWSEAYPAYARFDDGSFVNQAHNDWAQWAAEGGLPFELLMLAIAAWTVRPALRSVWGVGILAVFVHCAIDYPMQQRPALAAFFFAMLGALAAEDRG